MADTKRRMDYGALLDYMDSRPDLMDLTGTLEIQPVEFAGDEWGLARIYVHTETIDDMLLPGAKISVVLGADTLIFDTSQPLYVMGWNLEKEDTDALMDYSVLVADVDVFKPDSENTANEDVWDLLELRIASVPDLKDAGMQDTEGGRVLLNPSKETHELFDSVGTALKEVGFPDGVGYMPWNMKAGRAVTFRDVVTSMAVLRALISIMPAQPEKPEEDALTHRMPKELAQYVRGATRRAKTTNVKLTNSKGEQVLKVESIEDFLVLKASSRKTFLLIDAEATRMSKAGEYRHDGDTVCRVALDVHDVASLYGISEEWAKKRLRADFKALANQKLTMEKKGKDGGWVSLPVSGGVYGIRRGEAIFTLSPDVMDLLLYPKAPQVDLPPELYATDDTNFPAAFQIGVKLYSQGNIDGPNRDRMKLTTLLNAAKEIPTEKEIKRGRHSYTNKIMQPFEAAMDHLVEKGVLTAWDYCHENGEPLTAEEYQTIQTEHDLGKPTPWELARTLLVTWELGKRFPEHEAARQESREKRRAAALEARAKKEREAKNRERRIRGKEETIIAKMRAEETSKAASDGQE